MPGGIGCRTVNFAGSLAAEGPTTMGAFATIGV